MVETDKLQKSTPATCNSPRQNSLHVLLGHSIKIKTKMFAAQR